MNVHDELRRSLISKLTQVNERKLQKPFSFFQGIYTTFFSQKGIMWSFWGFFPSTHS